MITVDLNNKTQQNHKLGRNSFVELYRFLFAMWVVWYHGYFAFSNQFLDGGYMAVEFFFLLSGYHFLKTMNNHNHQPFFVGIAHILWNKVCKLGLPFAIGLVFVFWQRLLEQKPVLLGYLWYVPIMYLAFVVVYTLRRLLKKDLLFALSLVMVVVASYLILYLPIAEKLGVVRGLGAVSFGVLISMLPKIRLSIANLYLNPLVTSIVFALVVFLAWMPKRSPVNEYFLVLLLIPMLIYFTFTLSLNCKFFNFLGKISFAIYCYQCVLRVLKAYFPLEQIWLFAILVALVAVDTLIALAIKRAKTTARLQVY